MRAAASGPTALLQQVGVPALFVVLWSTGFIGAKLGLPYAGPLTFLTVRFWLAAALFTLLALAMLGVEAGVSAMIVSVQPLLVAALAGLVLSERVAPRQWVGLGLGLLGVVLILARKLGHGLGDALGALACIAALLGMTAGTLYQKRHCAGMDLRTGNVVQFAASGLAMGLLALLSEDNRIVWSGEFVSALLWLVLVLSLGAISLLYVLIRRGAASRVSGLFFLVPPCTALIAWPLFGETLGPVALLGMALTAAGVAMATR